MAIFRMARNIILPLVGLCMMCVILIGAIYLRNGIPLPLPEASISRSSWENSPEFPHLRISSLKNINGSQKGKKPFLENYKNPCWIEDGNLKCVPYFYTPGFGKSGSTSLFATIMLHPEVVQPYKKELNGWGHGNKIENMVKEMSMNDVMTSLSNSTDENGYHHKITGDGTPRYIWNLQLPKFLYSLFHETRIIIIMRHPTDRFFSHYSHSCRLLGQKQSAERLHKAVVQTIERIEACAKDKNTKMDCVRNIQPSDSGICQGGKIKNSVYIAYLPTWLKAFPENQVLLLEYEQFFNDAVTGTELVHKFLGLAPGGDELHNQILAFNQQRHEQAPSDNDKNLFPETKAILDQFFAPFNKMLADYLQDERFLFLRKNTTYALPPGQ